MLNTLAINNFAIIDALQINFEPGMTVLTGETGAGKSIIIDALSLIGGGRASHDLIRHDTDRATVQAMFDIADNQAIKAVLAEYGLPDVDDDQLLIQREIHHNGKSVARINGQLVTVSILRALSRYLIDIHGQHEHQELMDESLHLQLLDRFAAISQPSFNTLKEQYQHCYSDYQRSRQQLTELVAQEQYRTERLAQLQTQVQELTQADVQEDEDVTVEQQVNQQSHAQQIIQALSQAKNILDSEEYGVLSQLNTALTTLDALQTLHPSYQQLHQSIQEAYYQLEEVSRDAARYQGQVTLDEEQLHQATLRLDIINQLKRKYGPSLADVRHYQERVVQEYNQLQNQDAYLAEAQQQFSTLRQQLAQIGKEMSGIRQQAAEQLATAIHEQLHALHMPQAQFSVRFKQHESGKRTIRPDGLDDVAFEVMTNLGEPSKPLVKVASGGELSRLMLALKTIFTQVQGVTSIIFDEIDTGVSGRVARAIADKIYEVGHHAQVLCITHLPQVAAQADHQLFIEKYVTDDGRTATRVTPLDDTGRREAIATMLVGNELTEVALQQADALLASRNVPRCENT